MNNILRFLAVSVLMMSAGMSLYAGPVNGNSKPKVKSGDVTLPGNAKMHAAPLSFIENKGQVTDQDRNPRTDIQYRVSAASGLNIFVGDGAIHYQFCKPDKQLPHHTREERMKPGFVEETTSYTMYRMDVQLIGANKNAKVIAEQEQEYSESFYIPCINKQDARARAYNKITYKDVYPNIDWVLYTRNGKLEHEFVVRAGGRVNDIQLKYGGAENLKIDKDGSLTATTPMGTVTEQAPVTYQEDGKKIKSAFRLDGDVLSYSTGAYSGGIVIDPTVAWATYYGGTDLDYAQALAVDDAGCIYMTGYTQSLAGIATTGAYSTTLASPYAASFVAKFNPDGLLRWGTYFISPAIGTGAVTGDGEAIAADHSGHVWMAGQHNEPSTGAFIMLARFDSTGTMQWDTTYGGYGTGGTGAGANVGGLVIDAAGNVYVAGGSSAIGGIASSGAFQTIMAGSEDAFLTKFNSAGVIQWSTYYGGVNQDYASALSLDKFGSLYMCGSTYSAGMSTPGSYLATPYSTSQSGFMVKFDTLGHRKWGTYYDESTTGSIDFGLGSVCNDAAGNIYVAGYSMIHGAGYPAPTFAKFDSAGNHQWTGFLSTYGSSSIIMVDTVGNVFLTGYTNLTTGIATTGALHTTYAGGAYDGYLAQYKQSDPSGPVWCTYYGGSGDDYIYAGAIDKTGRIYLAGQTSSTSSIATTGAHQTAYGGGTCDGFLVSFSNFITGNPRVCLGSTTTLSDAATGGTWTSSNSAVGSVASATGVVTGVSTGLATITYTYTGGSSVMQVTVGTTPSAGTITGTLSVCPAATTVLSDGTTGGIWSSSATGTASVVGGTVTGLSGGTAVISYTVTNFCATTAATVTVTVGAAPSITSLSAYAGNPASSVTITGTNFNSTSTNDVVYFGATRATVSSASTTSLSVSVPGGATFMPVTVDNIGGCSLSAFSPYPFLPTYDNSSYVSGSINFDAGVDFTSGTLPYGASIGDIDGDGKPDIVVTNSSSNTISVYRNTSTTGSISSGSFAAKVDFTTDSQPEGVAIGDLDGDGKLDIVVTHASSSTVSVFRNTSTSGTINTSSLAAKVDLSLAAFASGVVIADMDQDGQPDIIVSTFSNKVIVFHNTGTSGGITSGSFATGVNFTTGALCYHLAVGDLDGDGKPDIATSNYSDWTVSVLRNTSTPGSINTGSFATNVDFATPAYPYDIAIADLDGDGKLDIATSTINTYTSLLRNTSTSGTISSSSFATHVDLPTTGFCTGIADMDGDGKPDLVITGNSTGYEFIYRNISTSGSLTTGSFASVLSYPIASGAHGQAIGDLDGDGKPDIVIADAGSSSNISILHNDMMAQITGTVTVCVGATTTLSDITAGGTWSRSSGTGSVNVGSTGIVTGVSAGTATVTYTVGSLTATRTVTVNPAPNAGTITGTLNVCPPATSLLADAAGSGTWSSVSTGVATVNSTSGLVTPVSTGTTTISYTVTNSCGTAAATKVFTVNPLPNAGTITGTLAMCGLVTTALSDAASGGVWSSVSTGVATVNSTSGLVTGVTNGTTVISYTSTTVCSTAAATVTVTVNHAPSAIYGNNTLCPGNTTTLNDTASGGVWTSSPATAGTINASTGAFTGITTGSVTVNYTLSDGCAVTSAAYVGESVLTTIAGTGTGAYNGDGGPAVSANINPYPGVLDASGNLYIGDYGNSRIRKVSASGIITTIAGTGVPGHSGDGFAATAAQIYNPEGIAVDNSGNVYFADALYYRKISTSGIITTIAGSGASGPPSAGAATASSFETARSIAVDPSGNVYVADALINYQLFKISTSGVMTKIAGTSSAGFSGDNGPAASAQLTDVEGLACDAAGNLYISDKVHVRKISTSGIITTIAGNGGTTYSGDGIAATAASMVWAQNLTVDAAGNVYFIDESRVRKIDNAGIIHTIIGTSSYTSSPDGTPVTAASVAPTGIAVDGADNLYIVEENNARARKIYSLLPDAGAITGGLTTLCPTATTTFSDGASGGVWSSSNSGVATVNSTSGLVTAVAGGSVTISYTTTNTCGNNSALVIVSVNPAPNAGTITGSLNACPAATSPLADAAGGGTWSSVSTGVATVNSTSGLVTAASTGTTVISYTVTNSCGTAAATKIFTVNPSPNAGTITGSLNACPATTSLLADAAGSGTWSSVSTGVATVNSTSGLVTASSAGTTVISYTVTNSCGTVAATKIFTVNPSPNAGTITGSLNACPAVTSLLADAAGSGTWSSVSTGIATVNSTSGLVTASSAGTTVISYTVTNSCGTAAATSVFTVNPSPNAGTITGSLNACPAITSLLADAAGSGTWSSVSTGVATVSSTSGLVTAASAGTTTISYTVTNSCGTAATTSVFTVNPSPNAGTITGSLNACPAITSLLVDAAGSGTWSSVSTGIATVNSTSGLVTASSAGTTVISYTVTNSCGTLAATQIFTVNPSPNAGSITGTPVVCPLNTTSLGDLAGGGTWSSVTTGVATINSTSGLVTGVTNGTSLISYTVANSCGTAVANVVVTVSPTPNAGVITGSLNICPATATLLSDGVGLGTWSSVSSGVATVNSTSGLVTGATTGTSIISYTVINSCGTAAATAIVTVNLLPNAGSITGSLNACPAATSLLNDAAGGGTWSSVTTGIATVNSTSGLVTATSAGTSVISYTVTNSCGTAVVSQIFTVNPLPAAGSITGIAVVCPAATITLSDGVGSGVWSSVTTGNATINSTTGLVTGVAAGTSVISYTVTNSCGTAAATVEATVNPLPNAGSITGIPVVCPAATITLSDAAGSGAWSSVSTGIAIINSTSGLVTGVVNGTSLISYTVINSCGTAAATIAVTVNPDPVAGSITGTPVVCPGITTLLSDVAGPGVWSSDNTTVATVGSVSGSVLGVFSGTANISYSVTNSCGTAVTVQSVTVNTLPVIGTISGPASVCAGTYTVVADTTAGGTWSCSNSNATITGLGLVVGITPGMDTIYYTVPGICGPAIVSKVISIGAFLTAGSITGSPSLCEGATTTLTDLAPGGAWGSVTGHTSVSGLGVVSGLTAGVDTIHYTVIASCGSAIASYEVTVNPLPDAGSIVGPTSVCIGGPATFTDLSAGGSWSLSNADATISHTGLATAVSIGADTLKYTITNGCGTVSVTRVLAIGPALSAGTISGPGSVCIGSAITLTDGVSGGIWSSTGTDVSVSPAGVVAGLSAGTDVISYTVTGLCATLSATVSVVVNPFPDAGSIAGTTTLCVGGAELYTDGATGGTWSMRNALAAITGAGLMTAVSGGADTVLYTVSNSCGTAVAMEEVTIGATVTAGPVVGGGLVCTGTTLALTEGTIGGVWSASNSHASVSSTGIVTAATSGVDTINYTVTGFCGTAMATTTVTVGITPVAGSVSGPASLCTGPAAIYTDAATGGAWSLSNSHAAITAGGVMTPLSAGIDTVFYTVSDVCGTAIAQAMVTINATPSAGTIHSAATVLCAGNNIILSESVPGGIWTSDNDAVATVTAVSGLVAGTGSGTTVISYTMTGIGGCTASTMVTVTVYPAITPVSVSPTNATICHGDPVTMTATGGGSGLGYQWLLGSTGVAGAISNTYTTTTPGSYSVVVSNGGCSEVIIGPVVSASPAATITFTAPDVLSTGTFVTYQWFRNGVAISGANTHTIHETGAGSYKVVVTDGNGCTDTSVAYVVPRDANGVSIIGGNDDISIYPNPAMQELHIVAPMAVASRVLAMDGRLIIAMKAGEDVEVSRLPDAMYIIQVYDMQGALLCALRFEKMQ